MNDHFVSSEEDARTVPGVSGVYRASRPNREATKNVYASLRHSVEDELALSEPTVMAVIHDNPLLTWFFLESSPAEREAMGYEVAYFTQLSQSLEDDICPPGFTSIHECLQILEEDSSAWLLQQPR